MGQRCPRCQARHAQRTGLGTTTVPDLIDDRDWPTSTYACTRCGFTWEAALTRTLDPLLQLPIDVWVQLAALPELRGRISRWINGNGVCEHPECQGRCAGSHSAAASVRRVPDDETPCIVFSGW